MPGRDSPKAKEMKRKGNLYDLIISPENLELADRRARKGKGGQRGVKEHDENREENLIRLHAALRDQTYRTSPYHIFTIREPKEREIYRLPYYPDRIVHHAVMNILEPIFMGMFTADTYSCIKGKGIHGAFRKVRSALRDEAGTQFCLKMDIRKFYPTIDHKILKQLLRRKFKDERLLWLLDEIIDSAAGLPIGNYLSQYFANFYLCGFDHWLKEVKRVRYYFRYADDLVILAPDKPTLHALLADIREYLHSRLRVEVKDNYQVFPVWSRGIDFLGYVFRHTHIRLRPSIKKNFARAMATKPSLATAAAYYGWACHADTNHLLKKLLSHEQFQRIRSKGLHRRLDRRKGKNRTLIKQADRRPASQDRALYQETRDKMPLSPARTGGPEAGSFFRRTGANRRDPKSASGRLPLHDHDHQG